MLYFHECFVNYLVSNCTLECEWMIFFFIKNSRTSPAAFFLNNNNIYKLTKDLARKEKKQIIGCNKTTELMECIYQL